MRPGVRVGTRVEAVVEGVSTSDKSSDLCSRLSGLPRIRVAPKGSVRFGTCFEKVYEVGAHSKAVYELISALMGGRSTRSVYRIGTDLKDTTVGQE